jgi:hypothetical protein
MPTSTGAWQPSFAPLTAVALDIATMNTAELSGGGTGFGGALLTLR